MEITRDIGKAGLEHAGGSNMLQMQFELQNPVECVGSFRTEPWAFDLQDFHVSVNDIFQGSISEMRFSDVAVTVMYTVDE
jgi:hypothetical protein